MAKYVVLKNSSNEIVAPVTIITAVQGLRSELDELAQNTPEIDLSDYYTKTEVDNLLIDVDDSLSSESENPIQNKIIKAALDNKQDVINDLSTIRSNAALGATALQSFTETDPTVPAWAKAQNKPTYTANEVGALPNNTLIPSALSDLSDDSTHRVVTDAEKSAWNNKYDKPISGIPVSDLETGAIPDVSNKADKATTLSGYGITDAYTKSETDSKISSVYKASGSISSVSGLGALTAANLGKVYDMSAAFTTTSDFLEGANIDYPAGTNVVIVEASSNVYKYDTLSGIVDISGKEDKNNKVTSISSSSTDTQYPSAKLLYDQLLTKISYSTTRVSNANNHTTTGYALTNTSTTNLPSECIGNDRYGIIFWVEENVTYHSGTQTYYPIDGTYKGRIFYRAGNTSTGWSSWNLVPLASECLSSNTKVVKYDSQTLSSAEQTQARTNIGAGTSNFSGSFNDLSSKPTNISGYGITDANINNGVITLGSNTITPYIKPIGGIPATDIASGVIPTVTVTDVTVNGTSVVNNGTAVIPVIPTNVSSFTNDANYLTQHQDVSGKADKTTINISSASTGSITLTDNNEYRFTASALTSLDITLPVSIGDNLDCWIVFNSGSTATSTTYPNTIKWSGDDVSNNVFVPLASKTYNIGIWYDGINVNAVTRGV